jgi:hypothetical protein
MASNNADKTPDLRLIDGDEDGGADKTAPAPGGVVTGDLVSEIILDSGLLPQDKVDLARARAAGGGTFAEALVEEGFARSRIHISEPTRLRRISDSVWGW